MDALPRNVRAVELRRRPHRTQPRVTGSCGGGDSNGKRGKHGNRLSATNLLSYFIEEDYADSQRRAK